MKTFMEWLIESQQDAAGRLESLVREYMATRPASKRCYYVTRPKNPGFDPKNPRHVEDELGPDYDKSLEVVPFKHHPASFTCANAAEGLANFLRGKGYKARKVAGWYGNAEPGYHAGYSPSLDDPTPPSGHRMSNPQQHWWVEADGYYVDITSAQFHPTSPNDQTDLVIRDKHNAFVDGSYSPIRRFPLGRSVALPPNAQRMVDKILSLKKFSSGHSSNPSDNHSLAEWIEKNAKKYGLAISRTHDIVASLRAHTRPGFYFADARSLKSLFGEGYDDLEEAPQDNPDDFKPQPKKASRGVVRFKRSGITLSSTYPDDLEKNIDALKGIVSDRIPGSDFGDTEISSEKGAYGNTVHFAYLPMKDPQRILSSPETMDALRKERFKVG